MFWSIRHRRFGRHGGHRAGEPGTLRAVVRGGHRLHRQARGCVAERLRAESDGRHPADAVPRFAGKAGAAESWQTYKLSIDVWSTSNVFKKGHVMRLEVSSSNFPRFDRNLNTGQDNASGTQFMTATNAVLHDAAHPSALTLPIVAP